MLKISSKRRRTQAQIKADKELLNSTPDEKRELVAQQLSNTGALIELLRHAAAAK